MKGKKCFGLLLALSIIFGLSLSVFSNDTNAFQLEEAASVIATGESPYCRFYRATDSSYYWSGWGTGQTSLGLNVPERYLKNIQCKFANGGLSIIPNDYVEFVVRIEMYKTQGNVGGGIDSFQWQDDGKYRGIYFEVVGTIDDVNSRFVYVRVVTSARANVDYVGIPLFFFDGTVYPSGIKVVSWTAYRPYRSTDSLSANDKAFLESLLSTHSDSAILGDIKDEISEQNERDSQDRDDLSEQSSDAESSANDSQADAQATGTTLLGAFSSFVNAMTSASPSNCNIDMDLGNLDLGVVDLCTLSLPAPFQALASIFLILFCVPLSIATARKVINLFRSFQG